MEKLYYKEVGRFKGLTFDGQIFEFIVCENGIYCRNFQEQTIPFDKMILKPNFVFIKYLQEKRLGYSQCLQENNIRKNYYSLDDYTRTHHQEKKLICQYLIDDDLLEYLINNKMIMYSTDIAYLYGLDSEYAYDKEYKTRAFKWVKKKSKILTKQKRGIFN